MQTAWIDAFTGGLLIGLSASILLLFSGQVAGISGIVNTLITRSRKESNNKLKGSRWMAAIFICGLLFAGFFLKETRPFVFFNTLLIDGRIIIAAGLLVGFGTAMGSGCTSGHGVCGISRFSLRSVVATLTFIIFGIATVFILKQVGVY
jgi:uncharacterized protein